MSEAQIIRMISVEDSPEMCSEDCYPQQLLPARLPAGCLLRALGHHNCFCDNAISWARDLAWGKEKRVFGRSLFRQLLLLLQHHFMSSPAEGEREAGEIP